MMQHDDFRRATERAIDLCIEQHAIQSVMRDFILVRNYDRVWAVFPDRTVEITPAPQRAADERPHKLVCPTLETYCSNYCASKGGCMPSKMVKPGA